MISLISDMTDAKGSRAESGWVLFDRECAMCVRMANRYRGALKKRGFGLAALQDPRAASLLRVPEEHLLDEMRVVTADGGVYGGADAIVLLAGRIWWAWPLYAAARWLGARPILRRGYRWVAEHRHCSAAASGQRGPACVASPQASVEQLRVRGKGAGK